jgi:hypothetical protein
VVTPKRQQLGLILMALLPLLVGCGAGVRHQAVNDFPGDRPYRVALLPLTNLTSDPGAAQSLGATLAVELLGIESFEVVDMVAVNSALSRNRIRYADRMNTEQFAALGRELKADGVLVGAVYTYEYRKVEDMDVPIVSMHARIIDVAQGQILWVAEQTRTGTDGEFILGIGLEKSLTRLGASVVHDIVGTLR